MAQKTTNEKFEESTYLNNPRLRAPNTPNEWTEERMEEFVRCKNDIIYFIENYIKIVSVDDGLVNFHLYPYQEKMVKRFEAYRNNVAVLPRQSGKSTVVAAIICHYILFQKHKKVGILAHKAATANEILSRVKLAYEHIPKWMQQGVTKWNEGSFNLENGCKVLAGATSSGAIRGFTMNLLFMDEVAHIPSNMYKQFFRSVYPTISSGKTTKIIMVSTPNGMNHFYDIVRKAQKNATDPKQKNNRNRFRLTTATWRDVPGRDEQWKEDEIANTSLEDFRQEQECRFIGATNTLLEPSDLNHLIEMVDDVKPVATKFSGSMNIYEKPKKDHTYFISADPAEGVGQDYAAVSIFDITKFPFKQVAAFRSKHISELLLAPMLNTMGQHYNNAFILVENNKGTVVLHSLNYEFEYENLIKTKIKSRKKADFGVQMNKLTKRLGCSRLKDIIEERKLEVLDRDTVLEFFTFTGDGKTYSAEEGKHDDMIVTLLLFAYYVNTPEFMHLGDDLESFRQHFVQKHISEIEDELPISPIVDTGNSYNPASDGNFLSEFGGYDDIVEDSTELF